MLEMDKTKQRIGIIGGGQLGKMMILEAKKMGFFVIILDPTKDCPAASIADQQIVAGFNDQMAVRELANRVDLITYEFEHIDVEILKKLEKEGQLVYPTACSLEIIQNKYRQKKLLQKNNIPIADFIEVKSSKDIEKLIASFNLPLILKSCTGGYDGKGNVLIRKKEEIKPAFQSLGSGQFPLMVERYIPFASEISVLACRSLNGNTAVYPVAENDHRHNILFETRVPARISARLTREAMNLARQVMEVFSGIGMFCVEMFVTTEEKLFVNEVAPRPHNSGHYSIEGCITSQFEQHIRAITGLPLGDTTLLRPTVMRNILGTGAEGPARVIGIEEALAIKGVKVHIYDKKFARPGRKMGHLTVSAELLSEAVKKAAQASELISIIGENLTEN